jgi:flagellar biosynthesis protein FlhF
MRFKSFSAPTMEEAIAQVRADLGDEAIIGSTYGGRRGRGVVVNAALDNPAADLEFEKELARGDQASEAAEEDSDGALSRVLEFHGLPSGLIRQCLRNAEDIASGDQVLSLASAVDALFNFQPLGKTSDRPVILVGAPGAGKTLMTAKIATRAVLAGLPVRVLTTDTVRAGAMTQLSAFTDILKTNLDTAATPTELRKKLSASENLGLTIIDSPGAGAFQAAEMADIHGFIDAVDAEPVFVLAAGGDPAEAAEAAQAFAALGAQRMIVTQVDLARRLGGVMAAANAASLAFAGVSISPFVAQGVGSLNPVSLARLLLRDPASPTQLSQDTAAE